MRYLFLVAWLLCATLSAALLAAPPESLAIQYDPPTTELRETLDFTNKLQIKFPNLTGKPGYFALGHTFTAKLISPEGEEVAGGDTGDRSPPASLYLRLGAGESWQTELSCYLRSHDDGTWSFAIGGFDGVNWQARGIHPGRYTLQIFYDSTKLDDRQTLGGFFAPHFAKDLGIKVTDFWAGQLSSNLVPIEFVAPPEKKSPAKAK